tara:strand:- start:39157 stop:40308 length:1152 start_codon:yes stop_codon:yes gene_type:complete
MAKSRRGRPSKNQEVENQEENLQEENLEQEEVEEQVEGDINESETPEEIAEPKIEAEEPPPPPQDDSEVIGEGTYGDYNPFAESVVERDYSTPQIASGEVEEIEEPQFVPPTYEDVKREREGGGEEEMGDETGQESGSPFDNPNPALNDLDTKDKKVACESLVDTCLDAYEQLHKYGQYIIKVDEETLQQKHRDGTLDLTETIPLPDGKEVSIAEFFQQYNEQGVDALKYDQEFGAKVKPAMLRVFMKRGWGMSDEQYLMYMFGRDIAVKVGIMWQMKKTINSTLESLEEMHLKKKRGQQAEERAKQQAEQEQYEEEYEEYEDEIEEEPRVEEVQVVNEVPKKPRNTEGFTESMEIDMPNKPAQTTHPSEIEQELKNQKNKKK